MPPEETHVLARVGHSALYPSGDALAGPSAPRLDKYRFTYMGNPKHHGATAAATAVGRRFLQAQLGNGGR